MAETYLKSMESALGPSRRIPPANCRLRAFTKSVAQITDTEMWRMYQVFTQYYDGHSFTQFRRDLMEKDLVILLQDAKTQDVCGFSTVLKVRLATERGIVRGIYSGDTVVDRAHWGSGALGLAFLKLLFWEKLRHPLSPLYWFLISKGYKTYLLMANNFAVHYPRHEKSTPPALQAILDGFYGARFPAEYQRGRIIPGGEACRLRATVADIAPAQLRNPRIAFFQNMNPDWQRGEELACVAEMAMWMPLTYVFKKLFRRRVRS